MSSTFTSASMPRNAMHRPLRIRPVMRAARPDAAAGAVRARAGRAGAGSTEVLHRRVRSWAPALVRALDGATKLVVAGSTWGEMVQMRPIQQATGRGRAGAGETAGSTERRNGGRGVV